jgi:hypothetical protein
LSAPGFFSLHSHEADMGPNDVLHIAEIPFPSGALRCRYARYLSADRSAWVRHGWFQSYSETGALASEGMYVDGLEDGLWRHYHRNGQLAAEGCYSAGQEVGDWRYWNDKGEPE